MTDGFSRAEYDAAVVQLDRIVSGCTAISQAAAGQPSETSRHYFASILFTRLCCSGISQLLLSPGNRFANYRFEHWDYPAIASISRSIIDCYVALFYLCVEPVPEDEWKCRLTVFNLHDCLRRKRMFKHLGATVAELAEWESQAEDLRGDLRRNAFFSSLPDGIKKTCIAGDRLYLKTRDATLAIAGFDVEFFRGWYVFLSCHVHSYPLGFYRTGDKDRGRGLESPVDRGYMTIAANHSCDFFRKAAQHMIALFPGCADVLSAESRTAICGAGGDEKDSKRGKDSGPRQAPDGPI